MSDVPVELIVAAFQQEDGAEAALKQLKAAKKDQLIDIDNAAVIRKDTNGKVHIKEMKDMGGGKGAAIGGVVGAAIGVLTGGVGLAVMGAGALVGGLAAKLRDSGFSDARLKKVGEGLTPGSSAIVAVIEHRWVGELEQAMQEAGADVLTEAISADIATQLGAGRDVAFSAISTEDALMTSRVAAGEDEIQMSDSVFTADGMMHEEAVANAEGIAAQRVIATDDAVSYEAAVVTDAGAAYVAALETDEGVEVIGVVADAALTDGSADEEAEGTESAA